jgi:hypothetical protein
VVIQFRDVEKGRNSRESAIPNEDGAADQKVPLPKRTSKMDATTSHYPTRGTLYCEPLQEFGDYVPASW